GEMRAQRGLCHRHVERVEKVVALAHEPGVRPDTQVHVEVPRGPAPRAGRAAAGEAQALAVVDAGRDVDGVLTVLDPAALAPALTAGRADLLAQAAAAVAGGGGDHLAEDRLADAADPARAAALRALHGRRPGLG